MEWHVCSEHHINHQASELSVEEKNKHITSITFWWGLKYIRVCMSECDEILTNLYSSLLRLCVARGYRGGGGIFVLSTNLLVGSRHYVAGNSSTAVGIVNLHNWHHWWCHNDIISMLWCHHQPKSYIKVLCPCSIQHNSTRLQTESITVHFA